MEEKTITVRSPKVFPDLSPEGPEPGHHHVSGTDKGILPVPAGPLIEEKELIAVGGGHELHIMIEDRDAEQILVTVEDTGGNRISHVRVRRDDETAFLRVPGSLIGTEIELRSP